MKSLFTNKKGFTILELILVTGLFFLFVGGMITVSNNYLIIQQLDNAANTIIEELRRAQGDAMAGTGDIGHGVYILDQSVTRFRGDSYATRDSDYDVVSVFPDFLNLTGDAEVVFVKNTGFPDVEHNIYVDNGTDQYTLYITEYGNIITTRGAVNP